MHIAIQKSSMVAVQDARRGGAWISVLRAGVPHTGVKTESLLVLFSQMVVERPAPLQQRHCPRAHPPPAGLWGKRQIGRSTGRVVFLEGIAMEWRRHFSGISL